MAAAEGKSIGRIVNCQAVLGFNLVSEVPGCDPCGRERNQIFFQLFFAGFLGLEAIAVNPYQGCVSRGLGFQSQGVVLARTRCCLDKAVAAWFVLQWGMWNPRTFSTRLKVKEWRLK